MTGRSFSTRFKRAALTLVLGLALCGATLSDLSAEVVIGVQGNKFTKNGSYWIPQGFVLAGLVAPAGRTIGPAYENAARQFGPKQLARARELGADIVRFQVSQWGLDPQSPIYDPLYAQQILEGVRFARDEGLAVILSMQWQRPSGLNRKTPLPTKATFRAWATLAPFVARERDVMLEVFNEPNLMYPGRKNWEKWWRSHQELIYFLRSMGLENVLLAGGLHNSHYLDLRYRLDDPLQQLAYVVHPFLFPEGDDVEEWDANFGRFSDVHPVLASAWNELGNRLHICSPDYPKKAEELLAFLNHKNIGVIAWALDMNGTILRNEKPTSLNALECSERSRNGAGELILDYFRRTDKSLLQAN